MEMIFDEKDNISDNEYLNINNNLQNAYKCAEIIHKTLMIGFAKIIEYQNEKLSEKELDVGNMVCEKLFEIDELISHPHQIMNTSYPFHP